MARTLTLLRVFVASPSDVSAERTILEEVVSELNRTWSSSLGLALELVRWETHSYPAKGDSVQGVINEQIANDYDIFVGILWSTFGTPTEDYMSGTEEEFEHAYMKLKNNPNSIKIMLYFKDTPVKPSKIDSKQLQLVSDFRKRVSNEGFLYHDFDDVTDFAKLLRLHLSKQVQDWKKGGGTDKNNDNANKSDFIPSSASDSLEDDDEGYLDLIEIAEDGMNRITDVVNRIAEIMIEFTDNINAHTIVFTSIKENGEIGNTKLIKNKFKEAAHDIGLFASKISTESALYAEASNCTFDAYSRIPSFLGEFEEINVDEVNEMLDSVEGLRSEITKSSVHVINLKGTMESLPRFTTDFNRAKRRAAKELNVLINEFTKTLAMLDEIHSNLQDYI